MSDYNDAERALIEVWEAHTAAEFELRDADAAIDTMAAAPVLTHVPSGTGASGRPALRRFYAEVFIPQAPADIALELLTRTVGRDRVVDEFILHFTHSLRMDWFTPGIEATGRRVEIPCVGIIGFEEGKVASEHIYWDQATALVQLGVLDQTLPVMDKAQCDRLRDPNAPANQLMHRDP